jgi:hypothetical protein
VSTRRTFLFLISVVAASIPTGAWTQQTGCLQKVGILSPAKPDDRVCLPNNQGGSQGCFLEALRALGYSEGRNIAVEYRFAEGAGH